MVRGMITDGRKSMKEGESIEGDKMWDIRLEMYLGVSKKKEKKREAG